MPAVCRSMISRQIVSLFGWPCMLHEITEPSIFNNTIWTQVFNTDVGNMLSDIFCFASWRVNLLSKEACCRWTASASWRGWLVNIQVASSKVFSKICCVTIAVFAFRCCLILDNKNNGSRHRFDFETWRKDSKQKLCDKAQVECLSKSLYFSN